MRIKLFQRMKKTLLLGFSKWRMHSIRTSPISSKYNWVWRLGGSGFFIGKCGNLEILMSRVSMDPALVGDKTWGCLGVGLAYGGGWLRSEAGSRGF